MSFFLLIVDNAHKIYLNSEILDGTMPGVIPKKTYKAPKNNPVIDYKIDSFLAKYGAMSQSRYFFL